MQLCILVITILRDRLILILVQATTLSLVLVYLFWLKHDMRHMPVTLEVVLPSASSNFQVHIVESHAKTSCIMTMHSAGLFQEVTCGIFFKRTGAYCWVRLRRNQIVFDFTTGKVCSLLLTGWSGSLNSQCVWYICQFLNRTGSIAFGAILWQNLDQHSDKWKAWSNC